MEGHRYELDVVVCDAARNQDVLASETRQITAVGGSAAFRARPALNDGNESVEADPMPSQGAAR